MDTGSGGISWSAGCGANYISCGRRHFANSVSSGRGYFANSIAYAVVSPTRYLRASATPT
jgi:hypothetical protein